VKEISSIPDHLLVRLFFRRLWQGYDAGGISVGRSIQASLLEAYLGLNYYEKLPNVALDLKGFADEADSRNPIIERQTLFGNLDNLSIVSSHDLSLLCIEALRVWYQIHHNEINTQGYVANPLEGKYVTSICNIMPIPFFTDLKSDNDFMKVWKEAGDRFVRKMTNEPSY